MCMKRAELYVYLWELNALYVMSTGAEVYGRQTCTVGTSTTRKFPAAERAERTVQGLTGGSSTGENNASQFHLKINVYE